MKRFGDVGAGADAGAGDNDQMKAIRARARQSPCAQCPFLASGSFFIDPERIASIAQRLLDNDLEPFHCHKTVQWDDEGNPREGAQICAGAELFRGKNARPSVFARFVTVRIGESYFRERGDEDRVAATISELINAHTHCQGDK